MIRVLLNTVVCGTDTPVCASDARASSEIDPMAECARMSQAITFGTDGWRAVIADGFTFDNVRRVTNAVGVAARSLEPPPDVDRNALAVGYDRRFLSREFAEVVAETLRAAGYRVVLSKSPVPSQTI